MILVKVAKLGSAVVEVSLADGHNTVEDALLAADMSDTRDEIHVRGMVARRNSMLREGDIVALVPPVKGGA